MDTKKWTRRDFVSASLAAAGVAMAARQGFAQPESAHGLAFVGSEAADQLESGAIHAFQVEGKRWNAMGTVPAATPVHLLAHPLMPVLYAVHNVDTWNHLPRGAVSAYRFNRAGQLHLLDTQPLSLAATRPRHAVLTAGASHLFVAAEGGGIYNLLPLAKDGSLMPVSAVRKEFGVDEGGSAKLAAPNSVALLPDGSLLAADAGQETLSNFLVTDGTLTLRHRARVHRGEGPAKLTLSPSGRFAYTSGATTGSVRRHTLMHGSVLEELAVVQPQPLAVVPLAPVQNVISMLVV